MGGGPPATITTVFSDNLLSTVITGAEFEIRVGGPFGTLVASGSTQTPVVTPTGRSGFGYNEFIVEVTGLNLDLVPGDYWLNVAPIGNGTGRSLNTTTSGANCVGTPCGNDGMSWFDSTGDIQPRRFLHGSDRDCDSRASNVGSVRRGPKRAAHRRALAALISTKKPHTLQLMNDKHCSLVRAAYSFTRRATLPALFVTRRVRPEHDRHCPSASWQPLV